MYVFVCGIAWTALQFGLFAARDIEPSFDSQTLVYGVVAGIFLALANILLIESLTHLNVSLGSTIYRLNTIGVVVLSFLFLGENLGPLKVAGVLSGVAAVWILHERRLGNGESIPFQLFLWVVIAASLFRAGFGIVSKAGLTAGADADAMLLISAACWIVGGLIYAALRERRIRLTAKKVAYGIASGTLLFAVVNTLIEALKLGEVSVLAPIANLSFIVALLISTGLRLEALSLRKGIAVAWAALSIFLLMQTA